MTIHRDDRRGRYTLLASAIWEDRRIGSDAVRVLGYLLSKPDCWAPSMAEVRSSLDLARGRAQRAVAELREAGYLTMEQLWHQGRAAGCRYEVYERPLREGGGPQRRSRHAHRDAAGPQPDCHSPAGPRPDHHPPGCPEPGDRAPVIELSAAANAASSGIAPQLDHHPPGSPEPGCRRPVIEPLSNTDRVIDPSSCACAHEPLDAAPPPTPAPDNPVDNRPAGRYYRGPLPADWFPDEQAIEGLKVLGIPEQFSLATIPEFIVYWRQRGQVADNWDARFMANVRRAWTRQQTAEQRYEKRQRYTDESGRPISERQWVARKNRELAFGGPLGPLDPDALF